jgi:glycosyltransferase involved in cell wall biosynthesis
MILLSWRPDVVHINTSGFLPLFALDGIHAALGRVAGAVTVLHVRGSAEDMWERTQPRLRGLQGRMFRRANRVLVLHQTGLEVLNRHGIEAHVMSNFVMSRPEVHRGDRSGPVRILFVGWLKPYKGVLELIEATGRLEGVELVLLGRFVDGAENEIRAAMSAAGLDGRVQLPGEVPLEEVWKHYEAADIFCLPSWTEGFPNTLVEAMMSGLPVVATPVGAIPEVLVDGETGTLTPVRDAAALETALRVLVADSALRHRMGDAGRARALSRYEMNSVLNQLADHYDELLQR